MFSFFYNVSTEETLWWDGTLHICNGWTGSTTAAAQTFVEDELIYYVYMYRSHMAGTWIDCETVALWAQMYKT